MNRAQINLTFLDEDLYKNLILPLKTSKRLRNLMLKLLTCYYYNSNVRDLVDNDSQDGDVNVNELFAEARVTLLALSSLKDNLGMTLDEGINKINSIANTGDTGIRSEFGTQIPKLEDINSLMIKNTSTKNESNTNDSTRLDMLEKTMEKLMSKLDSVIPDVAQVSTVKSESIVSDSNTQSGDVQKETALDTEVPETIPAPPVVEHKATEEEKNKGKSMLTGMLKAMG